MTEPITRRRGSERRRCIMSPVGAPPAGPAIGRVRLAAWFADGRRRPRPWTPGSRCGMSSPPGRARGSLDRHATYIVAVYLAGAAPVKPLPGSNSAWPGCSGQAEACQQ